MFARALRHAWLRTCTQAPEDLGDQCSPLCACVPECLLSRTTNVSRHECAGAYRCVYAWAGHAYVYVHMPVCRHLYYYIVYEVRRYSLLRNPVCAQFHARTACVHVARLRNPVRRRGANMLCPCLRAHYRRHALREHARMCTRARTRTHTRTCSSLCPSVCSRAKKCVLAQTTA